MPGIALEPEWILEPPDIPRDYEAVPAKLKLIPPAVPVVHDRRKQGQHLSNHPKKSDNLIYTKNNPPFLEPNSPFFKLMAALLNNGQAFEKKFYRTVTDFLNALCPT